jgi:hypothetical protein
MSAPMGSSPRGAMLDVAVWEAEDQDRRRREVGQRTQVDDYARPLLLSDGTGTLPAALFGGLDMHFQHAVSDLSNHPPQQAPSPKGVADRGSGSPRDGVLEVTVGKADHKRPCCHGAPRWSCIRACPSWSDVNTRGFRRQASTRHAGCDHAAASRPPCPRAPSAPALERAAGGEWPMKPDQNLTEPLANARAGTRGREKPDVSSGFSEADERARTVDLLHGKPCRRE